MLITWMAKKLQFPIKDFEEYKWKSRSFKYHLALIREYTEFEIYNKKIAWEQLVIFRKNDLLNFPINKNELFRIILKDFENIKMELPTETELTRLVNSLYNYFFKELTNVFYNKMSTQLRQSLNDLLNKDENKTYPFDWLKSNSGKLGIKNILNELDKLTILNQHIQSIESVFIGVSGKIVKYFHNRAKTEGTHELKRHPKLIKYTLICSFLYYQYQKITDNILNMFLKLIRQIEKKSDKAIKQNLVKQIKKVYNKNVILYNVAVNIKKYPKINLREQLLSKFGEEVFDEIIEEFEYQENLSTFDEQKIEKMKIKYVRTYRKVFKSILSTIKFNTNNPAFKPLIESLSLIKKYMNVRGKYYPSTEKIPTDLSIMEKWKSSIFHTSSSGEEISKYHFELYLLQKIEKSLKCKEIWVEKSYLFRNPEEDLPQNWNKSKHLVYCLKLDIPIDSNSFIDPIKNELKSSIEHANNYFSKINDTYIYYPGNGERGYFRVPKLKALPERPILQEIKNGLLKRWGILDLLDVLIEADRQIDFSRFFQSSAQRQVLNRTDIRFRLLLCLFGIGTNIGLKRVSTIVNQACSYKELLYFKNKYITNDSLRNLISELVNHIIELRNPKIWGESTTCVSDATHLGSWDKNMISEWNPHYKKPGVMAYWHVDNNSTCIFSQLKTISSSEVAAMLRGLIHHETEMRIESNYVDSHGQSEVAFTFCRLRNIFLHPRLRRIKEQLLYLPDRNLSYSNLKGVIARPIRWNNVNGQYSEMVRYITAAIEKTGPIDSILRRFHRNNNQNPTYKAFTEIGKALKTIHICRYLTDENYRREINDALNIVENWNSYNSFISYGNDFELPTNDPEMQELAILCIQLLQNAVILTNSILIEKIIWSEGLYNKMAPEDIAALTALIGININPYGHLNLDFNKPSFLNVA